MKRTAKICKWEEFCTICDNIKDKQDTCYVCNHYRMVDSAYGYCMFNPEPLIVAWCRDCCSHLTQEIKGGK